MPDKDFVGVGPTKCPARGGKQFPLSLGGKVGAKAAVRQWRPASILDVLQAPLPPGPQFRRLFASLPQVDPIPPLYYESHSLTSSFSVATRIGEKKAMPDAIDDTAVFGVGEAQRRNGYQIEIVAPCLRNGDLALAGRVPSHGNPSSIAAVLMQYL